MKSALAISLFWLVAAPGVVGGLVPWALSGWRAQSTSLPTALVGGTLVLAGTVVMLAAFARFVLEGHGSPMPTAAPDELVVGGLYRYVRNPMYLALYAVIGGQSLWLGRIDLLIYLAIVVAATMAFVHGYEEPELSRRFGASFDRYRRQVPPWIPRLTPAR